MVAIVTPYAIATVSTVNGTTIDISGGATPSWAGRCIRLITGSSAGQIRKIVSAPTASQITVDHAFDVSPISDFVEINPASGTQFVVSNYLSECADGTSLIYDATTESLKFGNSSHSFSGNVFVYDTNKNITLHSNTITLGTGACWRLGDLDATGRWSNGCRVQDVGNYVATGSGGWVGGVTTGGSGDMHLYGCVVDVPNNDVFWRLYRGADHIVRFIGCVFSRRFGGRVQGSKSALIDVRFSGSQSMISPINPVSPFGVVRRLDSSNSLAGFYHQFGLGKDALLESVTFSNVGALLSVSDGSVQAAAYTLELADVSISAMESLTTFLALGNFPWSGFQPTVRVSNYLTVAQSNAVGAPILAETRMVLRDVTGSTVFDNTSTSGSFTRQRLRYKDIKYPPVGNVNFTFNGAPGVVYAGYALLLVTYGFESYAKTISLRNSETVNAILLPDTGITRSVTSAASLSSAIAIATAGDITVNGNVTLDDVYDYAAYWVTQSAANALVANGFLMSTAGGVINTARNIIVSATGTLTAGTKSTSIRTTGSVTVNAGGNVTCSYTDSTGSTATLILSEIPAGSSILVSNGTTVAYVSNHAGGNYTLMLAPASVTAGIYTWVVNKAGYTFQFGTFTPSAGGVFSATPRLTQKLSPSGTPMFTNTTSNAVSISFTGTTSAQINVGDLAVTPQVVFDEIEIATQTEAGLTWLIARDEVNLVELPSGKNLFLTGGWRLRRALAGDGNAAVLGYVYSTDGTPLDDTNGSVAYLVNNTIAEIAAAVRASMSTELGRIDVATSSRLAGTADVKLDNIKSKTDKLTFTVTDVLDTNIQYVNDVPVKGVGSEADPWSPV